MAALPCSWTDCCFNTKFKQVQVITSVADDRDAEEKKSLVKLKRNWSPTTVQPLTNQVRPRAHFARCNHSTRVQFEYILALDLRGCYWNIVVLVRHNRNRLSITIGQLLRNQLSGLPFGWMVSILLWKSNVRYWLAYIGYHGSRQEILRPDCHWLKSTSRSVL